MSRRWHRTKSAAERVGLSEQTLIAYRMHKKGPAYSKVGRICIYDESDLDAWIMAQRIEPAPRMSEVA